MPSSLMERTRMVRRPYLSARMPHIDEESSIPRNTTVVSVACWYSRLEDLAHLRVNQIIQEFLEVSINALDRHSKRYRVET